MKNWFGLVVIWVWIIGSLVFLIYTSDSDAATPLTQTRADKAATAYADDTVDTWSYFYDDTRPVGPYYDSNDPETEEYNTYIESYELDNCDVSGRKAECDITYHWAGGDLCDSIITVRTTRRNKVMVDDNGMECDDGYDVDVAYGS